MPLREYAFIIEQSEDGGYWGYLPDLPGCTTAGDSVTDVQRQLPDAVALYLSYYRERGLPIPEPRSIIGTLPAA